MSLILKCPNPRQEAKIKVKLTQTKQITMEAQASYKTWQKLNFTSSSWQRMGYISTKVCTFTNSVTSHLLRCEKVVSISLFIWSLSCFSFDSRWIFWMQDMCNSIIFHPYPQGSLAKNSSYPIIHVAFLLHDSPLDISFFHKQSVSLLFLQYFCNALSHSWNMCVILLFIWPGHHRW